MDGAGRSARSVRSQEPQADLKAAAIGAAVLLRERLGRRAPVQKRPVIDREPSNRLVRLVERYLPNRLGVALTVLMLLGSAGLGIVKGGHVDEFMVGLSDTRNALANSVGFRITEVAINGRRQLSQDEVLAIGGVNGRSSLLFLDATTLRDKLKANPWIADAAILKLYPGRLQIDIVERTAFALWQQDGRLAVIAEDGAVLEPFVARRFVSLPLVVGKGADVKARDFLALLDRYPQVRSVTKAAILVGERRWNLRLKDGLDIRLPDRLTVQLSEEAAKAREELFKDKKPKKKPGDSA
jgi:cell division protein FtsQ